MEAEFRLKKAQATGEIKTLKQNWSSIWLYFELVNWFIEPTLCNLKFNYLDITGIHQPTQSIWRDNEREK